MFTKLKQIFPAERGVNFSIMLAKSGVQEIVLIQRIFEPQLYRTDAVQTCFQLVGVCLERSLLLQNFSRIVFANLSSNVKDPCLRGIICASQMGSC